jgi:SAM-dependent methyltransferase
MSMSDEQHSSTNRIASAIRCARALLSTPKLLNRFELQIVDISKRLDELSAKIEASLDASSEDLKSELSAQLSFNFYDQAEFISLVKSTVKASHSQIDDLVKSHTELRNRLAEVASELMTRIKELQTVQSESRNAIIELISKLNSRMNGVETYQFESRNILGELNTSLNSRMNALETFQVESRNILVELSTSLNSRLNSVETFQIESRNIVGGLNTSLNSRLNSVETYQFESTNFLSGLQTRFDSRMNSLETLEFELRNLITHTGTSVESRFNGIDTQQSETKNLLQHINTSFGSRLNSFEFEMLPAVQNQIHELLAVLFSLNAGLGAKNAQPHTEERYRPAKKSQWNESLARAEREFYNVFPFWKQRLNTMLQAFRTTKVGNAAWAGDVKSRVFRGFVDRYAHGRVLDVGCGVFGRPYYLSTYAPELISGIDPLKPEDAADFEFVRGISEYLPWPDASFSTVISATSLDHCLSLDRSLSEIQRVLRPKGCFLLWIDSIPGAPVYEPSRSEFVPSDQYHLFHFDVAWFEPVLTKAFEVVDRIELQRTGYISVMYCLQRVKARRTQADS